MTIEILLSRDDSFFLLGMIGCQQKKYGKEYDKTLERIMNQIRMSINISELKKNNEN